MSMLSIRPQSVAFYDQIASTYDEALEVELSVRRSFQSLVLATVPDGAVLLDFGCGTGTDAAFYAGCGYRVIAWDPSRGMLAQTVRKCAPQIASKRLIVVDDLAEVAGAASALTANFAVVSLISDLPAQFADWARMVEPGGCVILSIQNPWYWKDMSMSWWWRGLRELLATSELHLSGGSTDLYRRCISAIARAARPFFRLESRSGAPCSKFRFLVFRRCPD